MYIIEYHRFVAEPSTWIGLVGLKIEQMHYHDELEQSQHMQDAVFSLERAQSAAYAWLKNHYGYVRISFDTEQGPVRIKLCNHCKFIKKFLNQGVQLIAS